MEVVIEAEKLLTGMTPTQAKQLGKLIAAHRVVRGLSSREVAEAADVAKGWVNGVESGRFLDPAPERLARIMEVLDIEPARIERITQGAVAEGLPELRTYLRAKYDLSPENVAKVERYIERLRRAA